MDRVKVPHPHGHSAERSRHRWPPRRPRGVAQRRQCPRRRRHDSRAAPGRAETRAPIRPGRRVRLPDDRHAARCLPHPAGLDKAAGRRVPAVPHVPAFFPQRRRRTAKQTEARAPVAGPLGALGDHPQSGARQHRLLGGFDPGRRGDVVEDVGRPVGRAPRHRRDARRDFATARDRAALSRDCRRRVRHHRARRRQAAAGVCQRHGMGRVRGAEVAVAWRDRRDLPGRLPIREKAGARRGYRR